MKSFLLTSCLLLVAVAFVNSSTLPRTKLEIKDTSIVPFELDRPFPLPLPTAEELKQIFQRILELYKDFDYNPRYLLTCISYAFGGFYMDQLIEIFGELGVLIFFAETSALISEAIIAIFNLFLYNTLLIDLVTLAQEVLQKGEVIVKPFVTALVAALEDGKITSLEQLKLTTLATLALPKVTKLVTDAVAQVEELVRSQSEALVREIINILENLYNKFVSLFPEEARKLLA